MAPELAQRILNNLSTGVLWFDGEQRLRAVNSAAENLLGVSGKQLERLAVHTVFPQQEHLTLAMQRARAEHSPVSEHGVHLATLTGGSLTVDYTVTPCCDTRHAQDVLVELMSVDQHLRLAREENLLLQHQAVQTVIRGVAHEIKNPLGGLRGAAQLLARELTDPELREYTDIVISEADRLQSLLDQLLGPRVAPRKQKVNVHKVLFRVNQLIASEVRGDVHLVTDFDPSIPDVSVDPDQLLQAVLNIMRNAVQAMDGKGTIQLRTRVYSKMLLGQRYHKLVLRLDIQDNGPGIPPELQGQVFYPMVTGRPDGSGLGLSIAQTLMSRNGGLIGFSSQAGKTVFTIWLPL